MMKRTLMACALASLLLGGEAAAVPGVDEPSTIHVKALRNPEIRKYKAILAGLDTFEKYHALAPKVPELRFRLQPRRGAGVPEQPVVRIEGRHDFVMPLALDATNRFSVPRSEAALDAAGELVLNQKRRFYQIMPEVRTPGLPDNVRRLGDLRLECKVMIDIAKEEIPLWGTLMVTGVLGTRDWCSFFSEKERSAPFPFKAGAPVLAAVLHEGNRSKALETENDEFRVGLSDAQWSDDALVELTLGELVAKPAVSAAATGTAGETPRTAP
jgi:hypothetical protein